MQIRLNININTITAQAIESVAEKNQVSKTEAVRRLIGVGWYLTEKIREGHEVILEKHGDRDRVIFDIGL